MAFVLITKPDVGSPTRKDAFADLVVDNMNFLYNALTTLQANDILNGSFEIGSGNDTAPTNWELALAANNHSKIETTNALVRHGAQSFSATTPGGVTGGASLKTADFYICGEAEIIALRWYLYSTVAATRNEVFVHWYDWQGALISSTTIYSSTANPTSWETFGASAKAPAGARFFKIEAVLVNNAVAGTTYLDGVSFRKGGAKSFVFTASGVYTPSTNVCSIRVRQWAGGGGGGGGGGSTSGSVGNAGGTGGTGGDSWVGSAINNARGGAGGAGGGGVNQSVSMQGLGGEATAAAPAILSSTLLQFGKLAGVAGNAGNTFGPATPSSGGRNTKAQNIIMTIGADGGYGSTPGSEGADNTGTAGGGGASNTTGPGGGASGAHGEYAECVLDIADLGVSATVTVGAAGAAGTGGFGSLYTGTAGGKGGSGMVIIEEIG